MESTTSQGRRKAPYTCCLVVVLLLGGFLAQTVSAKTIKVGVAQTVIEATLQQNCEKLCLFIEQAKRAGCQIVVFPEGALYWADVATHEPTQAALDAAITQIGRKADAEDMYIAFGVGYRERSEVTYRNRGVVFDRDGRKVVFYRKNIDVPRSFDVCGVPFNLVICSDRGYLEYSDLPCLVQGSQVIVDISGGHGGDDGRPDLRWIRYRPWTLRTGAFVIVSNPVHPSVDFMGHSPWGGGSAVIRPDGSVQASRTYEKDALIVEELDVSIATRAEAERRRNHPLFKSFWDAGEKLLDGEDIDAGPAIKPYSSVEREIKIAGAQIACSSDMGKNVRKIASSIRRAAREGADIVVFPELAVTGSNQEDICAASQSALDGALKGIREAARREKVYVIVGMPHFGDGHRRNCAFVIGDDGSVRTRYAQIATKRDDLFQGGMSTQAMWFDLKGVRSIVTIGDDANWVEIADLAASRGMVLHFHITSEAYSSADDAILATQRNLLMLAYAKYGAAINAASAADMSNPSDAFGGMGLIVSREGGHNKPAPSGLEYYLPYQTSIAKSAGKNETMICVTRRTSARNDMDLARHWRNRNRRHRVQRGWYEWVKRGAALIEMETRARVPEKVKPSR